MTLHSAQWGVIIRILYKHLFREQIAKVVKATDNELDDKALQILDQVADYGK